MSRQITQPVNQVRLTNVAVVRMNRSGKRFEVACYRNKIVNYRQGTETDVSEVLQTDRVFTNVSKGQFAKSSDLRKAFQTTDEESICRTILLQGQVQVSDLERSAQHESTLREVANMIAEKCVDPRTQRPYTVHRIRSAMTEAGFMVRPTRNAKQNFLECVKVLKDGDTLPIERAKMELAVIVVDHDGEGGGGGDNGGAANRAEAMRHKLAGAGITDVAVTKEGGGGGGTTLRLTFRIDPSLYRTIDAAARSTDVNGRLEIVRQTVTAADDGLDVDVPLGGELPSQRRRSSDLLAGGGGAEGEGFSSSDEDDDDALAALSRGMERKAQITDDGGDEDENEAADSGETERQAVEAAVPAPQAPLHDDENEDEEEDSGGGGRPVVPSAPRESARKANKKAQKKSKKARRREKEETAEREARIQAEKERREERAAARGGNEVVDAAASNGAGGKGGAESETTTRSCNTCGGSFAPAQYRSHFRSDWHRYNIKLKMKGVPPVSEEEFLLCDSDAFFDRGA